MCGSYSSPHKRNHRLRPFLVLGVLVRELLLHEPVFSAHAPEKNGAEDDEKKDKSAAAHHRRTHAREKASGIHRVAHIAVRAGCHQLMPHLGRYDLAPVSAQVLPRPDQDGHACGAHNDPETTQNGVYGGEVDEAEYPQVRKHERGDNPKRDSEFLRQVRFGVPFYAHRGNGQIHDDDEPESIDEPDKDRCIQGFIPPSLFRKPKSTKSDIQKPRGGQGDRDRRERRRESKRPKAILPQRTLRSLRKTRRKQRFSLMCLPKFQETAHPQYIE